MNHSFEKRILTGISLLAALLPVSLGAEISSDEAFAIPARLTVPRAWTLERIVIDGDLRDRAWEQGTMTYGFVNATGDSAPTEPTRARIIHDYDALYIAFTVEEADMDSRVSSMDDKVGLTGDSVGFVLEYESNGTLFVTRISVDHEGNFMQEGGQPSVWGGPGGIESAVAERQGAWDVEIAIPWAQLSTAFPSPGDIWRVNFYRNSTSNKEGKPEKSSWLPAGQKGELRFGRDCLVYLYSKRPFYSSDEIMVYNYADRLHRLVGTYVNDQGEEVQSVTVHLGPGHRRQHYRMEGLKHGMYYVIVRDREAAPGTDDVVMVVPRPQFGK
ncbi:MAG: carbohydrate-binding family 9-like protein [Puniceicoccaceae bacterium]